MSDPGREQAKRLRDEHLRRGDPAGWFEPLYAAAREGRATVPWADRVPNPLVFASVLADGAGRRALKIGCGLGDDAEELARRGFKVTAFDISATAIRECRERFPASAADYRVADLLSPPAEWRRGFDFVLESYTLQVLPPDLHVAAMDRIADFVAPGGTLLLVARGRDASEAPAGLHWALTRDEVEHLGASGLRLVRFEDFRDGETPPVRRFRVQWTRD